MLEKGTVVFGNWTVEERIGSGAFGTVYKIKREDFGAVYYAAMKVIRIPQDAEEKTRLQSEGMNRTDISEYYKQIVTDFGKEIQLLSTLDGVTNIVDYKDHVIEPNEDSGYTIYIKMQLLTPVSKLLIGSGEDAKFLSADEIIKLGKDICSALEVCERKRIIHRDIKIDNIFVSEDGDYKLGDFGIARKLEATQGEMSKKGTLMYMAPEVFKGEKYDKTADIYSLGIVLYRLLNKNRAPFFPDYPQPIKFTDKEEANNRRLNGEVVPPIKGISDELNAILRKACAYNPRDRYQSASDFKAALEGVGENVVAPVNSVFPEEKTEMLLPEILSVKSVFDDTADEATVGIFDTAADVPVSENTETEAVSDEIEAYEIVTNPSFDESDLTATQAIFANEILSDTIFEKETVTLAEPEEKTESAFSEAEEDEEKEIKESKEPKEPKKDKKKKKGAIIIIIALILLIAIGVGIFFAVKHFSGKKDGAKTSTTEAPLSENGSANDTPVSTETTAFFVYLDLGNGEERKKFLMEEPGLVGMPPNPTRDGYVFAGWYSDLGFTDIWDFTTDIATGETVIYAKWVAEDDENIDDIVAQLPVVPDVDNNNVDNNWYNESDESVTLPVVTVAPTQNNITTEWSEWSEWSDWTTTPASITDSCDVRTRTVYVYDAYRYDCGICGDCFYSIGLTMLRYCYTHNASEEVCINLMKLYEGELPEYMTEQVLSEAGFTYQTTSLYGVENLLVFDEQYSNESITIYRIDYEGDRWYVFSTDPTRIETQYSIRTRQLVEVET